MEFKKYQSLSTQAENINTRDTYKQLIEVIRNLTYEEMFQPFYDVETILEVIIREGLPDSHIGIWACVKRVVELGEFFLKQRRKSEKSEIEIRYTYEFCDGKNPTIITV